MPRAIFTALRLKATLEPAPCTSWPRAIRWTLNPLYWFTGGTDGSAPYTAVIFGPDGTLYGTTGYGGVSGPCFTWGNFDGCGVAYNLSNSALHKQGQKPGFWNIGVLYNFTGYADGANPYGGRLIFDAAGNLSAPRSTAAAHVPDGLTAAASSISSRRSQGGGWTQNGPLHLYRRQRWRASLGGRHHGSRREICTAPPRAAEPTATGTVYGLEPDRIQATF